MHRNTNVTHTQALVYNLGIIQCIKTIGLFQVGSLRMRAGLEEARTIFLVAKA